MERTALYIVIAVLGSMLPGCGGGGSDSANGQTVSPALQRSISRNVEQKMGAALHARRFKVTGVECEPGSGGVSACQLQASDGRGHSGTVSVSVSIAGSAAQLQLTGVSNEEWQEALAGRRPASTTTTQSPLR